MITAKVKCASKSKVADDQHALRFDADYNDGRNKEWSKYTPSLSIYMTVNDEAAKSFEAGAAYTLQFVPE